MTTRLLLVVILAAGALAGCGGGPQQVPEEPGTAGGTASGSREVIRIVGSSTVYPFVTMVAERFGRDSGHKTPVVESTGTGGGIKLFCAGLGVSHPDLANASRRIKSSELELCRANGVSAVTEVAIGFDGIVVASGREASGFGLTREQLFTALAKQVPTADGTLRPNPHRTWQDVDRRLPATGIEVYGPPPTSGTRDAFVELVMEAGCQRTGWVAALREEDEDRFKSICHAVREDGAWIEAGENDNLIVQKLTTNADALGVFGFSFLDQNRDAVEGHPIDGVAPTFEAIADGSYPVSRPLFVYVKAAHVGVIPGIPELVAELTSERASGDDGYLADIGLIPLPAERRAEVRRAVEGLGGQPAP